MRAITALTCLLLCLPAACGKPEAPPAEKAEGAAVIAPVETVAAAAVPEIYEATGTVQSKTTTPISSKMMGNVVALHAREGDVVKAGQLLVEIDPREAQAELEKARAGLREAENALQEVEKSTSAARAAKEAAEANLALAEATFGRYQSLQKRHSVSAQEFDEVQARYRSAQAEVRRAQDSIDALGARKAQVLAKIDQAKAGIAAAEVFLGYSRITSPMDGIVTAKQVEVGMLASPGVPLLTLEDPTHYRLAAGVEESRIGKVRIGEAVSVYVDAAGEAELPGKVAEIVPAADPASRTYTVKVDIVPGTGPRPHLRSGLFGRARFPMGERQAITVPAGAVVERGQLVGVYALDKDDVARLRLIKTGKERGGRIEVLSGLGVGDRIVAGKVEKVSDGARIEPQGSR